MNCSDVALAAPRGIDGVVAGDILELAVISLFLVAVWVLGKVFELLKSSALVGELIAGVVLGPPLLRWFHLDSLCALSRSWILMGLVGVTLLTAEAGLESDPRQLLRSGVRALLLAACGVLLAFGSGIAILFAFGTPIILAVGGAAALAPTSLAFAATLLKERQLLSSPLGQLVVSAAVIDDVLSLILLSEITSVLSESSDAIDYVLPALSSVLLVACGMLFSVLVAPRLCSALHARYGQRARRPLFFAMLICVVLLSFGASAARSSFLLGAYLTGLIFSSAVAPFDLHGEWRKQLSTIQAWLVRFFFAATVAFVIPLDALFNAAAVGPGVVLWVVSGVLGKLSTGFFAVHLRNDFLVVGAAMVGRGEYSFIIANSLISNASPEVFGADAIKVAFGAVIWSLVLSSLVAPFLFRLALWLRERRSVAEGEGSPELEKEWSQSVQLSDFD